MAEGKKSFVLYADLIHTVSNSIRFNDRYGLQFFEPNSFNKIDELLSLMRRNHEISHDEYHKIYQIYLHYKNNFYKIKNTIYGKT